MHDFTTVLNALHMKYSFLEPRLKSITAESCKGVKSLSQYSFISNIKLRANILLLRYVTQFRRKKPKNFHIIPTGCFGLMITMMKK